MEDAYYLGESPEEFQKKLIELTEEEKQQLAYFIHTKKEYKDLERNLNGLEAIVWARIHAGQFDEFGIPDPAYDFDITDVLANPNTKAFLSNLHNHGRRK